LNRPPTYIPKFFSCELGAQATFDKKNDGYIVSGAHLRGLLDVFIETFVLCALCKNPETGLLIPKAGRAES
ncbi:translation initiation factor IF2/IF5, partial [Pholiota molesta]